MRIGILGTGLVAQTLAAAWSAAGHDVVLGSRTPESKSLSYPVAGLADTVTSADVVVNATPGAESLRALTSIGAGHFAGKVVIDVANASTPEAELIYPNSSLGERLQAALPDARIVKTMNTAAMSVITSPSAIGPSSVFLSGDDPDAKKTASALLADFGWPPDSIVDLGGIRSARGTEHYALLFFAIAAALKSPDFNIRLVH